MNQRSGKGGDQKKRGSGVGGKTVTNWCGWRKNAQGVTGQEISPTQPANHRGRVILVSGVQKKHKRSSCRLGGGCRVEGNIVGEGGGAWSPRKSGADKSRKGKP